MDRGWLAKEFKAAAPNEKDAGATGPPASSNFFTINDFQRAGDRTRTGFRDPDFEHDPAGLS
jgi:hypothetical protein